MQMRRFVQHTGVVVPLDRANVDTDMIIPKQFLKSISRSGFGPNLFDEYRYLDEGVAGKDCSQRPLNRGFVLNHSRYSGCSILLARENFGCGSSREHAPWALDDFGIKVVIAPSFAEIFYNNCLKNGLLPIVLKDAQVEKLFLQVNEEEGYRLDIDLQSQQVITPGGERLEFEIDSFRKHCLLQGLDDIAQTLQYTEEIRAFEVSRMEKVPWLFNKKR